MRRGTDIYDTELWRLEFEFERFCYATLSAKTYRKYSATVYAFLKMYPKKVRPQDFYVTDVEDWAIIRGRVVAKPTVDAEVNVLRYFFNWASAHAERPFPNPATRRKQSRSRPEPNYVSVEQLLRLRSCATGRDSEILSCMLRGQTPSEIGRRLGIAACTVRLRYARLRTAADFPLGPKELPAAVARLCLRIGEVQLAQQLSFTPPLDAPHT